MGNRFKTRELKRVLSIIHYDENDYESRVKIFCFLQWLKDSFETTEISSVRRDPIYTPQDLISMPGR